MRGIMKPVVVLGATGVVGRGIVQAALARRRPVVAVARDADGLAGLRARHPGADLTLVAGSVADDAASAALAVELRNLRRPLAGVVAAIAGVPSRGRLLDQPASTFCERMCGDVVPHLAAARALLPLLANAGRGGSYVLVGGPGSELPWSGYGQRSVAAASLRMLARVLHDEARPLGVRVQLLSVEAPVRGEPLRHACPNWPTAVEIGERALALVADAANGGAASTRAVVPFAEARHRSGRSGHQPESEPLDRVPLEPAPRDSKSLDPAPPWLQDARTLLQDLTPSPADRGSSHETP